MFSQHILLVSHLAKLPLLSYFGLLHRERLVSLKRADQVFATWKIIWLYRQCWVSPFSLPPSVLCSAPETVGGGGERRERCLLMSIQSFWMIEDEVVAKGGWVPLRREYWWSWIAGVMLSLRTEKNYFLSVSNATQNADSVISEIASTRRTVTLISLLVYFGN